MKVILLRDVKGVGKRFDIKEVSDGYANNALLPQGSALVANKAGLLKAEQLKSHSLAKHAKEEAERAEKEAKRLEKHHALEAFKASNKRS